MRNTTIIQSNDELIVGGKRIVIPPGGINNVTIINNRVYIDGKEYVNGEWKRTFKSLWHKFF